MKPTQELMAEHNAVLLALKLLEKVEDGLAPKDSQATGHLEQLLDFLREFVDRCHHGKEEDVLFPELEQRGVRRDGGPIGVMLAEHEVGRRHVREMSDGLARLRRCELGAAAAIRESSRSYRDLLQAHIYKENNMLFPMADRLLPDDVAAKMLERFEVIERDRVGEGKHEAYHAMLHRLKDIYRIE
ncbi:MAG: hemerythrin domain-containing protein [Pseudomonadota bacterium]